MRVGWKGCSHCCVPSACIEVDVGNRVAKDGLVSFFFFLLSILPTEPPVKRSKLISSLILLSCCSRIVVWGKGGRFILSGVACI